MGHEPNPLVPSATIPDRMAVPDKPVDCGDQVIGSTQWFDVPITLTDPDGVAVATVDAVLDKPWTGHPFDADRPVPPAQPDFLGSPTTSLRLANDRIPFAFAPRQPGEQHATLTIQASWVDGERETHTVSVVGRAHDIDDVPAGWGPPAPAKPASEEKLSRDPESQILHDATDLASHHIAALADAQLDGVTAAERECLAGHRKDPEGPAWKTGVQIALMMGINAVSAAFGKAWLGKLAGKALSEAAVAGIEYAVEEGLKSVTALALTKVTAPTPASEPGVELDRKPSDDYSSNQQFAFFEMQRSTLLQARRDHQTTITNANADLRKLPPETAASVMMALASSFGAVEQVAMNEQRRATELQWVAGIARRAPNQTLDRLPNGTVVTTNRSAMNGRLQLSVSIPPGDLDDVDVQIDHVEILGVSKEVADQLRRTPLSHAAIPIQIDVDGAGKASIFRDEAGRVFATGSLPAKRVASVDTPLQLDRSARIIADKVLAKTLKQLGVDKITTDDATDGAS